jgi:hypothetical protein
MDDAIQTVSIKTEDAVPVKTIPVPTPQDPSKS